MRISDWSSDVCSSDLDRSARLAEPASLKATLAGIGQKIESGGGQTLSAVESKIWNTAAVISYLAPATGDHAPANARVLSWAAARAGFEDMGLPAAATFVTSLVTELAFRRSEEHTSELQSLMRISYAVFCLKKKKKNS